MSKTTTPLALDVYVVQGKRKPLKVGATLPGIPKSGQYVHEGTTYYFNNADLVAKTITFTSVPNNWQ